MAKLKLKGKIAKLEDVDEKYRDLYDEREGAFYLQADGVDGMVPATHAAELRADLERLRTQMAALSALGDPADIKKRLAKLAKKEEEEATAAGDFETLKKQLVENHATELQTAKDRETALLKALEERLVDAEAVSAIAAVSVDGETKVLLPHVKTHLRMVEKDGKFTAEVHQHGKPWLKDGAGTPMALPDLLLHLKGQKEFATLFKGSKATGTGVDPNATAVTGTELPGSDPAGFLANLDKIAKGEVKVATSA